MGNLDNAYELIRSLESPAREFSPVPFWFLNDDFSDSEIIRQMEDFNSKGVHGVVLHPRIGIPESIEYLSDEFMHMVETAVKTAARLNMRIVLYDEGMYPSGSAHGMVVKEDPRYASQAIILTDDKDEGKLIARTDDGKYIVQVNSGGTIRGIHFGEDDGQENAPAAADLLSKDSVDTFIRLTHERYYSRLKKYFGNTVTAFFTDEPSALGRCARKGCFAWTWGFEETIEKLGGKLSDLSGLFTGEENDTVKLYKKAIFERECNIYYKSLSDWCTSHGVDLIGHPHRGDDIECERFFGIPGQDVVLRWVSPESGALTGHESTQGKCSSDAARIMGRRRNLNECCGVCVRDKKEWYFTGGDFKWYIDWLGVRGVNYFVPHAFFYSVTGRRKDERPPDVGPNNIWWRHFDKISTYIKRISYIMTDSYNTARVAVLCSNRNLHPDEVAPFYKNQVEFNYVPYNFIPEGAFDGEKLTVGNNRYDYVLCDTEERFPEAMRISSVFDVLHRDIYTDTPCEDLRVSSVIKNGARMWLLVNEGEDEIKTGAAVEASGGIVKYDLWNGKAYRALTSEKNGKLHFNLDLKRRESVLLISDSGEGEYAAEPQKEYANTEFRLTGESKEEFTKTYVSPLPAGRKENLYIKLNAEEMVECFVNGSPAGFSLWNEHEFYVSPYLYEGENEVRIVVTGSAANKFTDNKIEYGIIG